MNPALWTGKCLARAWQTRMQCKPGFCLALIHAADDVNGLQLYINGELLGGADIVEEMQQSGELQKALTT